MARRGQGQYTRQFDDHGRTESSLCIRGPDLTGRSLGSRCVDAKVRLRFEPQCFWVRSSRPMGVPEFQRLTGTHRIGSQTKTGLLW